MLSYNYSYVKGLVRLCARAEESSNTENCKNFKGPLKGTKILSFLGIIFPRTYIIANMRKRSLKQQPIKRNSPSLPQYPCIIHFWILTYHNEDSNVYISHYAQDQISGIYIDPNININKNLFIKFLLHTETSGEAVQEKL